jgi:hypothetical protein
VRTVIDDVGILEWCSSAGRRGGICTGKIFPNTQPFGPMFIGFRRVEKEGVFIGCFQAQGLDIKGLERFYAASQALTPQRLLCDA